MWSSQFDSDFDDSEKISHQLRLSGGNEVLYISVPLHYSININLSLFFDAREAMLHRFLYNEYAIVAPSLYIHEELHSRIKHEIFSNSKDINGVNGSDDLFSSLENKSTDTLMTHSPQKMKIINISSDDSDMTLANGSVDLFSCLKMSQKNIMHQLQMEKHRIQPKKLVLEKSSQCNIQNADSVKLREEIAFWQTHTLQQQEEDHDETLKFKLKEEGRGSPYSCKDITSLPAPSSISTMAREDGILSELHLKETLSNSNNLTLLRDATTKRGRRYYGVKLCTDKHDFTLASSPSWAYRKLKKIIQLEQSSSENREVHVEEMETNASTIANENHDNGLPMIFESDSNNNVTCIMDKSTNEVEYNNLPTNYVGKHIRHLWDEGSNILTEYDGKLLEYNSSTMTFRVISCFMNTLKRMYSSAMYFAQ
ncbi:unnamed protein product [Mytilus coruscus]|uniref:Uncharacterized protein n=1 Tax=Mytilus coruscus TaxID=42192 RepID=A0A6J7ZVC5_MYTCO|nr:unnamed protein product [Mytilus coruscus]